MTSRELVHCTLDGGGPQRVARQMWTLPWAEIHYPDELRRIREAFPDDITFCPHALRQDLHTKGEYYAKGAYIDEWGCRFENLEDGIIGQVKHPPIKSWEDVEQLRIPRELLDVDTEVVSQYCASTDTFVIGGALPRPFERLQRLRGTEVLLTDLVTEKEEVSKLLARVHDFFMEQLDVWCRTDIDGIWFMDDWGSQAALLISPDLWREIFLPCYRDYIQLASSRGKRTFFHSDGNIRQIIGSLADAGLDAINAQIFCMDIEELGKEFGGKITFWGEIDRQHLLPHGTREDIRRAVQKVYESLYHRGHVIAQCEFGPGANPQNVYEVFASWNLYPK